MSNVEDIAKIALLGARDCLESRNYGRAFANLLLFLKLKPGRSVEVYREFSYATREWFGQLEKQNRLDDLFKCYDQACELFPRHDAVLSFIGTQLFRLGFVEKAAVYIRKSLSLNPDDLLARNNLENVCSHLVERWHFSMLNDKRRNMAYECAIYKAIKSGYNTVLDVGTGTGILSMMAEMSGAVQVIACDGSHSMIDIAENVFEANGVSDKIILLHKHSTDIQIPQHIPNKVKLLVTEIFDAGLFGEHIVTTMIHAWKNLISTSPMGTVVPCGATMYVCGIESETIRQQSRFLYPVLQYLDMSQVELLCKTGHIAEDPYTTESLAHIRGGYKILTNITELLRVNFSNLWELESLNAGRDWMCELFVKQSGRLDALAVWFDLHLDDTVTIETGPLKESCWEQVIYPITSVSNRQCNSNGSYHLKKRDTLQPFFHFGSDCLILTDCKIRNEKLHTQPKQSDHPVPDTGSQVSQTSTGTSVDECCVSSLPFRKRKVDNIECCEITNSDISDKMPVNNTESQTADTESDRKVVVDNVNSDVNDCIDGYQTSELTSSRLLHGPGDQQLPEVSPDVGTGCESPQNSVQQSNVGSDNVCDIKQGSVNEDVDCLNEGMQTCLINCKTSGESSTATTLGMNTVSVSESEQRHPPESVYTTDHSVQCITGHSVQCVTGHSLPDYQILTLYADEVDIEYINDIHLSRMLCNTLCNILVERKSESSTSNLSVLHITSRLSFLGIQAAVMGYHRVTIATNEEHIETINQVALLNGCKDIVLTKVSELENIDTKFDVILCDVVESCGALLPRVFENIASYRFSHLKSDGRLLPGKVKIHGMFIESNQLETTSHVTENDKTLGFHIADFINIYQMQNHVDIDLSTLNFTRLTDVQEMLTLDFDTLSADTTTDFLKRTIEKSVHVISSGKASAFVYWFELELGEHTVIDTLSSCYHWKQAGIMMSEDVHMETGQTVVTQLKLENSFLDVKVLQILKSKSSNGHAHVFSNGI